MFVTVSAVRAGFATQHLKEQLSLKMKEKYAGSGHLTLIRAAGGVYDFWNFEQVKLHNALKNEKFYN